MVRYMHLCVKLFRFDQTESALQTMALKKMACAFPSISMGL